MIYRGSRCCNSAICDSNWNYFCYIWEKRIIFPIRLCARILLYVRNFRHGTCKRNFL